MKRVGIFLALCLAAAACDQPKPEPDPVRIAEADKPKVVTREAFAVPVEERPTLGKVGDTTCAKADNEILLGQDEEICLNLLKDSIKTDKGAISDEMKLARVRADFLQPGPQEENETVGWVLYSVRIHCTTKQLDVMGNVTYRPDGVEISRATPLFGPRSLDDDSITDALHKQACAS
jgi:hypothetical protein